MPAEKKPWSPLRRTPRFRRSWLHVIICLLSVYIATVFFLTMNRQELQVTSTTRPTDWALGQGGGLFAPLHSSLQQHKDSVRQPLLTPKNTQQSDGISVRNRRTKAAAPHTLSFGFVMRDFARRVLSRHISSSNVLVIARDATSAAKEGMTARARNQTAHNFYDSVDFQSPYSIGGTFLLHAAVEGHDFHAIDFGKDEREQSTEWVQTLDEWWASFGDANNTIAGTPIRWSSTSSTPKWIIAAVFDHYDPARLELVDKVWAGADRFLSECTMTYVVVAMHSRKVCGSYEYGGLEAAKALLDHRYKLQALQLSHYHTDPGKEAWTEAKYGPNAFFKGFEEVQELLRWGADTAERYNGGKESEIFTAYVFATQGLDLAIPSSRIFVDNTPRAIGEDSTLQINHDKPLDFKPCPQATLDPKLNISFTELLGDTSIQVAMLIEKDTYQIRNYHYRASPDLGYTYQDANPKEHFPDEVELWVSNSDFNKAEAACARLLTYSKCVTRVITNSNPIQHENNRSARGQVPNILLILIDPISRPHFHRSMPKTARALKDLGFVHFGNYTAIGPNSGKNQAGLYSGMPLANRDGIKKDTEGGKWLWDRLRANGFITLKTENGCIENSNMVKSLEPNTTHGSELTNLFCFDFDRPNCLGPDLAAQILMNYGEEFITKYEKRRKEVDPSLRWAAFLHFIDTHEDTMVLSTMLDAKMSSFIERLAEIQVLDNTLVMLTSDHGLHYGPYFESRSGRREATEPLLYISVPPNIQTREKMEIFGANAAMWTTPFDVHETMVSLSISSEEIGRSRKGLSFFNPFPKERKSCAETTEIPSEYCVLKGEKNSKENDSIHPCTKMPRPPNVLSFYSDFPTSKRTHFPDDCKYMGNETASQASFNGRCQCATSHRKWHHCGEHPWGPEGVRSKRFKEEYFALVKCLDQKMLVDTRVFHSGDLLNRIQERELSLHAKLAERPPHVLLLDVDSVTLAYADRHLRKTRTFLKQYKPRQTSDGQIQCNDGVCAPDFNLFSLNGPNSISNQIAALSGCLVARFDEQCFEIQKIRQDNCSRRGMFTNFEGVCVGCPKGSFLSDPLSTCQSDNESLCCSSIFPSYNTSRVCRNPSRHEFGLQLTKRGPGSIHATFCPEVAQKAGSRQESPWILDVAKKLGYVTSVGEEYCYEGSPAAAHATIFPGSPDFELKRLYCRLQESRQYNFSAVGHRLCVSHRTFSGSMSTHPGFNLIHEIWHNEDLGRHPKFFYLNTMAVHESDPNSVNMVSLAEEFDGQLADFLHSMTSLQTFANTIIILRSNPSMQGGPTTTEFSTQVEDREPWAQLIVPRKMIADSIESIFYNQDRIVTAHDIYRTLRELMESTGEKDNLKDGPAWPPWSYNLLRDTIPVSRKCVDAKVPLEFCPCEEQVYYRPPRP